MEVFLFRSKKKLTAITARYATVNFIGITSLKAAGKSGIAIADK
jgi:hypothetical protein